MVVAGLPRHLAGSQRAAWKSSIKICASSRLGVDPAALARRLPLEQRDEDAEREQVAGQIGDRDAGPHRPVPGKPVIT